ncbi:MAG: hypothetical protein M0R00_03980, partial [Candidatus Omnitrophica bacterium]|nr:hypothetical protein [Candidatus Omnitrophota bacterium]
MPGNFFKNFQAVKQGDTANTDYCLILGNYFTINPLIKQYLFVFIGDADLQSPGSQDIRQYLG